MHDIPTNINIIGTISFHNIPISITSLLHNNNPIPIINPIIFSSLFSSVIIPIKQGTIINNVHHPSKIYLH